MLFRQAVINLIDNAIKYSPARSTTVVAIRRNNKNVCLDVIDEGEGIPPEHRAKVFDRFYRVDKSRSREQGGTGLGLSIARWAVEVHGGKLDLVQKASPGSVFRITLPELPDIL